MHRTTIWLVVLAVAFFFVGCQKKAPQGQVVIGFVVKTPEESWFQNEWKFAQQAADHYAFKLVKIGALDGEKALAAVDNLAAQHADGLIICTPDPKLGPAIAAKAKAAGMKLLTVDDQFIGGDNKPMDVHYLGISASDIGKMVGKSLYEQMQKRGWKNDDTALCMVTIDQLETGRQRTEGAAGAMVEAGFPADRIFRAPWSTPDASAARDAANIVLTQHPQVKHWLVCSTNDVGVTGAIRAMEKRGFDAQNAIGVGINGGTEAQGEFRSDTPFWGSILLKARTHGYGTAEMMYLWIKDGKEPPKLTLTDGILVTRDNYQEVLKEQGLLD
jgi:L-arabinose transport system substrate-binding protein